MSGGSRLADPEYVRFQYDDDKKLRVRIETHRRYSENRTPFVVWVLGHVDARPGQRLLDVGSGPGQYHDRLAGVRIVAVDSSAGMLAKVRVPAVQADAQALPIAEQSFDRVMANHMLYHVPDPVVAMRELKRVTAPGGRVVMATNSRDTLRRLFDLESEAARAVGIEPSTSVATCFGLEDVDQVRAVFPRARVEIYEDAFVFQTAEPLLAYVATMAIAFAPAAARARYLALLGERVTAIIASEGVLRIPKRSGCFIADV